MTSRWGSWAVIIRGSKQGVEVVSRRLHGLRGNAEFSVRLLLTPRKEVR